MPIKDSETLIINKVISNFELIRMIFCNPVKLVKILLRGILILLEIMKLNKLAIIPNEIFSPINITFI